MVNLHHHRPWYTTSRFDHLRRPPPEIGQPPFNGDFTQKTWGCHGILTPSGYNKWFFSQQYDTICTKNGGKLTNKNRIQCEMHRIEMYIIKNILYLGKWLYWLYIWLYIYICLCTGWLILIECVCVDSVDMYLTSIAVFKQWWILRMTPSWLL